MDAAWAQVYAVWAQAFVGLLQTALIGWGLYMMQQASAERSNQMADISRALTQQTAALAELLKRSEPHPQR